MILRPLTIARNTFIESLRQPVLLFLVLLCGLLQFFNTWNSGFSMGQTESSEVAGDDKLLLDVGLATIFVCGTLLAGFIATAVVSREIENKTVLTVVSKPVGRPVLILGKFFGVSGAILTAVLTMLLFLLMGIRHGVMSTAADDLDGPVLVFSFAAVFLSLGLAAWCNFFYGWNFPQTAVVLLLPFMTLAYLIVLVVGKKWQLQWIGHDFKPQVTLACACLVLAILVLTSIATAASTRLGQVMTIVICLGAFLAALLSNYIVGRHVFINEPVARVAAAWPADPERPTFLRTGDYYEIGLEQPPKKPLRPGDSIYLSPGPNGYPALVAPHEPFVGDMTNANDLIGPTATAGVLITKREGSKYEIRHIGPEGNQAVVRAPEPGDYVFTEATKINYVPLVIWGVVPNLHFFWLLDAVSQHRTVPPEYVLLACIYAVCQIVAFVSLAVVLFQKRDVG